MINKKKKALIHIAKKQVGMADTEYRDLLGRVGVKSSTDLNAEDFNEIMRHFRRLGFRSSKPDDGEKVKRKRLNKLQPAETKRKLLGKVEAQLIDLKLPWSYVDSMAKKMFGADRIHWCLPGQLVKIIAALTYHQQRRQKSR